MIIGYNISLEYNLGQKVLNNVILKVSQGSFHFLTGGSGTGKTSLLNILSLALQPTSGRLKMFGREVTSLPRVALPDLRRKIGMVRQDFALLEHLSVADNVALPLKIMGGNEDEINRKVIEMLGWIGLGDCRNERPNVLSGGQQQRVAIARAVINNPPLLIADEPSGNLDHSLSQKLMYLFEALNKMGTTVIFATHDEGLVREFNHPILHIENGMIVNKNIADYDKKVIDVNKDKAVISKKSPFITDKPVITVPSFGKK